MADKPTYEALEQGVKELDKGAIELKRVEEALQESEAKYRALVEEIPAITYMAALDEVSTTLFVSSQIEQVLGFKPSEWKKGHDIWLNQLHPDDRERVLAEVADSHTTEEPFTSDYRMIARDGRTLWITDKAVIVKDGEGKPMVLQGIMFDITDRKQMEEALQQRTHDLGERVKELNCLYGISELVEKPDISLEDIFQGTVDLIPACWQHPEITCARAIVEGRKFTTENFQETNWRQTKDIIIRGKTIGSIEVCYLKEKPEIDEGPFLKEERSLINVVAERLGCIVKRIRAEEELRKTHSELEAHSQHLEEVNTALKVLLKQRDEDRKELEENILSNVKQLVIPHLERLKQSRLDTIQATHLSTLESNLNNIVSPFISRLSSRFVNLTPMEIRVADLIKEGKTNKEIGEMLYLSPNTIKFHRYNVRTKLGLKNKSINLRSHLMSLAK